MASLLTPVSLDDEFFDKEDDWVPDDDEDSRTDSRKPLRGRKHDRLIKSISRLDKAPAALKKIERTETAARVGDQDLSSSVSRRVSVAALLKKSDDSSADIQLKKKLAKKGAKVLAEPLKRHQAVKVERALAYDQVRTDLGKWDKIVKTNRVAEGVSFPLDQTKLQIQTTSEYVKRYQTKTPLEQEIEELLGSSKNNLTSTTILTEAEREALKAMSIEEAEQRRHELQKHRALLSYREQKARWQSKIKSKSYHRHLRRAKRKIEEKDIEDLKLTDPEAASEKLGKIDMKRVQERVTLKHRGTGKWARRLATRAKTDKNAREALQEQLRLSRSLAEKIRPIEMDEKEDQTTEPEILNESAEQFLKNEASQNPWMSSTLGTSWEEPTIDETFEKLENSEKRKPQKSRKPVAKQDPTKGTIQSRRGEKRRKSSPAVDDHDFQLADGGEMIQDSRNVSAVVASGISSQHQKNIVSESDIDPNNVVLATRSQIHKTVIPDSLNIFSRGMEDEDTDDEQREIIAEAFADDDVVGDFDKHKKDLEEEEKPKDIDLSLPGWGDWTGAGIGPNMAKKKKFTIKAPKGKSRKDKFLTNVVISEKHDEKIVPHQVKELPFPFTTVEQFHSSIRMPVGKLWNTEAAFDEMTKPRYTTKKGVIIKPMNAKTTLKKRKRKKNEGFADSEDNELGKTVVSVAKKELSRGKPGRKKSKTSM